METIKNIEIYELGSPEEKSSPWSSTILILKLTSSEGRAGFGEAPTTMMTLPVKESLNEVARIFQDKNYFDVEKNIREYYRNAFYVTKSIEETAALSAFEIASWDLIGKNLGSPVYNLLGGEFNDKIRAYANGWYSDCVTPDDFINKAKKLVSKGYTAFKFDPFGDNYDKITVELVMSGCITSTIPPEIYLAKSSLFRSLSPRATGIFTLALNSGRKCSSSG